jgi:hypothetical protein
VLGLYKTKRKFFDSVWRRTPVPVLSISVKQTNKQELLSDHPLLQEARVKTAYVVLSERTSILEGSGNPVIYTT